MSEPLDDNFYKRADAHIHLSNDQLAECPAGKVSASMMYATARFNIWVTACRSQSGKEMERNRSETLEYFIEQFRLMLQEHHDDYSRNFASYMQLPEDEHD